MSAVKQLMTGLILGAAAFLAIANMVSQTTGAKIFVYQGF